MYVCMSAYMPRQVHARRHRAGAAHRPVCICLVACFENLSIARYSSRMSFVPKSEPYLCLTRPCPAYLLARVFVGLGCERMHVANVPKNNFLSSPRQVPAGDGAKHGHAVAGDGVYLCPQRQVL